MSAGFQPYPVPVFHWQDPYQGCWRKVENGMVIAVISPIEKWREPTIQQRKEQMMRRRKWGTWAG